MVCIEIMKNEMRNITLFKRRALAASGNYKRENCVKKKKPNAQHGVFNFYLQ